MTLCPNVKPSIEQVRGARRKANEGNSCSEVRMTRSGVVIRITSVRDCAIVVIRPEGIAPVYLQRSLRDFKGKKRERRYKSIDEALASTSDRRMVPHPIEGNCKVSGSG